MILLTVDLPMRNEKLNDCCASPVAKNLRVNARRSVGGIAFRNVVFFFEIFVRTFWY